jgi:hypothetical protein
MSDSKNNTNQNGQGSGLESVQPKRKPPSSAVQPLPRYHYIRKDGSTPEHKNAT